MAIKKTKMTPTFKTNVKTTRTKQGLHYFLFFLFFLFFIIMLFPELYKFLHSKSIKPQNCSFIVFSEKESHSFFRLMEKDD